MKIFSSYRTKGFGWIRFFGFVLHWKDSTKHKMLFKKNGYAKFLKIGKWGIRITK